VHVTGTDIDWVSQTANVAYNMDVLGTGTGSSVHLTRLRHIDLIRSKRAMQYITKHRHRPHLTGRNSISSSGSNF
jgi:hypothetical protein